MSGFTLLRISELIRLGRSGFDDYECRHVYVLANFSNFRFFPHIMIFQNFRVPANFAKVPFLLEIMKDDRLLQRVTFLRGVMQQSIEEIMALPDLVFIRLSSLTDGGITARKLRTESINVAVKSVGFLEREGIAYFTSQLPL